MLDVDLYSRKGSSQNDVYDRKMIFYSPNEDNCSVYINLTLVLRPFSE